MLERIKAILGFYEENKLIDGFFYVRKSLQLLADLEDKVWTDLLTYEEWGKTKALLFNDDGTEYLMWSFLDGKGLIEADTTMPSRLTQKGRQLLADMNEIRFW